MSHGVSEGGDAMGMSEFFTESGVPQRGQPCRKVQEYQSRSRPAGSCGAGRQGSAEC